MKKLGSPDTPIEETAERALGRFAATNGSATTYRSSVGSVASPVHRGVESACFDVDAGGKPLFLKVRYPDMADFFEETLVQEGTRRASELGVGACLVDADEANGCYLLEKLDGTWHWGKVDDFESTSVLENTVRAKKAIHRGEAFSRGPTVFETIEGYYGIIRSEGIKVPKTAAGVLEKVRQSAEAIAAAGVSDAPCHGDGVASNVMICETDAVRLVDFDSAGNHDPYFDLGSLIVEIAQFPDVARSVLEIYEGECREAHLNRCMLYGIADDLKWALWGFISFAKSPRLDVEFVKYAEWRLLRSLFNAEGPDFGRWIAKL